MAIAAYIPTCAKNVPGNRYQIYLTEIANITSITETSNEASAVTMTGGTATFKRVNASIDSVQYTSEGTYTTKGGETQNLIFKLWARSTELEVLKASLVDGVACGLAVIWVDNNGRAWLMGANAAAKDGITRPITQMASSFDSGLLITDDAGLYTITLTKLGAYAPIEFDSALTAKIITTTDAAFIAWT
jgi:hypothetical protein